jgi:hypothetical protein
MNHFTIIRKAALTALLLLMAMFTAPPAYAGDLGWDDIDYDNPILKEASQISSNAPTNPNDPGYSKLLDGDANTTFISHAKNSGYDIGTIKECHYLRLYDADGFPERMVFSYQKNPSAGKGWPLTVAMYVSNNPDGDWKYIGTVSTDNKDIVDDGTSFTLKNPITAAKGYKYMKWQVMEISINFQNTLNDGFGHPYFEIGEFNLYPCIHHDELSLQALYDSYPSPEEYATGKGAGMVSDATALEEYTNIFYKVASSLIDESMTDTQKESMAKEFSEARAKLDKSIIPLTDGNYVLKWGTVKYGGKNLVAYCDAANPLPRPVADDGTTNAVWNIRKLDNGNYVIRNVGCDRYFDQAETLQGWSAFCTSSEFKVEQLIFPVGHTGKFKISSAGNYGIFLMGYADSWNTRLYSWVIDTSVENDAEEHYWYFMPYEVDSLALYLSKDGDPENIVYGNLPSMISDSTAAAEYRQVIKDATALEADASSTREQKSAMWEKYKEVRNKALAKEVPLSDGVYYIQTLDNEFKEPYSGLHYFWDDQTLLRYEPIEPKAEFMWRIKRQSDGNYSIQNYGNDMYIYQCKNISGWSHAQQSEEFKVEQVIMPYGHNGKFRFRSASQENLYYMALDGHWVYQWSENNIDWSFIPVPAADLAKADSTVYYTRLNNFLSRFNNDYTAGENPGDRVPALYQAMEEARDEAQAIYNDPFDDTTEAKAKAAYEKLKKAIEAFLSARNPVDEGIYAVYTDTRAGNLGLTTNDDKLHVNTANTTNPYNLWQVTRQGDGTFHIKNYATGGSLSNASDIAENKELYAGQAATPQIFTLNDNDGSFTITDVLGQAQGLYLGAANTCTYTTTPYHWYLKKVSKSYADSVLAAWPETQIANGLSDLISEAKVRLMRDTAKYVIDLTQPVVTDASQLYVNNLSFETPDLKNLIDGDNNTYIVSAWNDASVTWENDYHSLRIEAQKDQLLPQAFGLHWRMRGDSYGGDSRPTDVAYWVSNDGINWTYLGELKNPEAGFPVTDDTPEYTSTEAIITGKPYRYFKMSVIQNSKGYNGRWGKPYFSFAELNLYPMTPSTGEAMSDPQKAAAAGALASSIADAQMIISEGKTSVNDINALHTALLKYDAVMNGSATLITRLAEAKAMEPTLSEGSTPFTFTRSAIDAFKADVAAVEAKAPFEVLQAEDKASLILQLENAMNNVYKGMNEPDSTVWYYVETNDASLQYTEEDAVKSLAGHPLYVSGSDRDGALGVTLSGGKPEEVVSNPDGKYYGWRIIPTTEAHKYIMQSTINGWGAAGSRILEIMPLGGGQFSISMANGAYMQTYADGAIRFDGTTAKADSCGAFSLEAVSDGFTEQATFAKGSLTAHVNPYKSTAVPSVAEAAQEINVVVPCGYKTTADGKTVTELYMRIMPADMEIPAGMPYIIKAGTVDDIYTPQENVKIDFNTLAEGSVTRKTDTINGMTGTYTTLHTVPVGMIYFEGDSAITVTNDRAITIPARSGYLNLSAINITTKNENADGTFNYSDGHDGDMTVYFKGGVYPYNPVGIANVSKSASATSNVYTTDGTLVKKNASSTDALKGLKKGIYITGGKKTLVK